VAREPADRDDRLCCVRGRGDFGLLWLKELPSPRSPSRPSRCSASGLRESEDQPANSLFPSSHGGPLTRDGIERRLAKHIATAERTRPTLGSKRVSMHVLRRTAAMTLLNAPESTRPRSRSGWATNRSALPTSTCTPTSRSNSARLTESHSRAATPAATERPTLSSPSSKGSGTPARPLHAESERATRSRRTRPVCATRGRRAGADLAPAFGNSGRLWCLLQASMVS
jgi:hypothetical protein